MIFKKILVAACLLLLANAGYSQFIYKIKTDSLLVTNDSCNAEFNLENSTRHVPGFLYNKGNGRTEFRKGLVKVNDSLYLIGGDTLNLGANSSGQFWKLNGNAGLAPSSFLGSTDNNSVYFRSNNQKRMGILSNGIVNIGSDDTSLRPVFRFYPNGDFTSNATNNYNSDLSSYKNGIRYHARLGYLELGTSNLIDTSVSNMIGPYQTSALILNTDSRNKLYGQVQNSIIAAYNVNLNAGQQIRYSIFTGGSVWLTAGIAHSIVMGNYHSVHSGNNTFIGGNSQQAAHPDQWSGWFGFYNQSQAPTLGCLTTGMVNRFGGASQLTAGQYLYNKSFASTALGNSNVEFTSYPYIRWDSLLTGAHNIERRHVLLAVGNGNHRGAALRSNALTMLYSGRTQINTTGFDVNLTETDVTPKAALEVVSTNSGVLLPKLTTTQIGNIASGDLHNGLLLYNMDSSAFQYYNGSVWRTIGSGSGSSAAIAPGHVLGNNGSSNAQPTAVPGVLVLNTISVSNAATLDIDLSSYYTLYDKIELEFINVRPSLSQGDLLLYLSSNGTTFDNSAGDYKFAFVYTSGSGVTPITSNTVTDTGILLGTDMSNATSDSYNGTITITDLDNTSAYPSIRSTGSFIDASGDMISYSGAAKRVANQATQKIRLQAAGNISGTVKIIGYK